MSLVLVLKHYNCWCTVHVDLIILLYLQTGIHLNSHSFSGTQFVTDDTIIPYHDDSYYVMSLTNCVVDLHVLILCIDCLFILYTVSFQHDRHGLTLRSWVTLGQEEGRVWGMRCSLALTTQMLTSLNASSGTWALARIHVTCDWSFYVLSQANRPSKSH